METESSPQHICQQRSGVSSQDTQDLHLYEERFALAMQGSNDGWWERDLRTNIVYFSPRWKQIFGYAQDEPLDCLEAWIERVHPDDREHLEMLLQQQMNGYLDMYEIDHRIQHQDGTYRWIRARGSARCTDEGTVSRIAGWHTDITERKQEEQTQARQAQHASFRADVSMALAERATLRTTLQRCTEAMVQHFHAAFARIWTLKQETHVLVLQASAGEYTSITGSRACIPLGVDKIGQIAQARQSYLTNDALNDPRIVDKEWARRERMVAFAGYPLLVDGQVVGVMAMFSHEPLMKDTLEALAAVAQAIAQGIGRKWAEEQLEERVKERTKELALLLEVSHNIASKLELRPLLDTILLQLKTVVDYSQVLLYTLRDEQLSILHYQGPQLPEQMKHLLTLLEQDMTRVIQSSRHDPFILNDIYQDVRLSQFSMQDMSPYFERELVHLCSWMGVPLMVKDRIIGFFVLSHNQPRYYTQQHVSVVQALANQAAVALENAQLYGQARDLAVLQERQRLARELHDSVSQALYGIVLGTRTARTLLERDPRKLAEPLDYILSLAESGLTEMRALIFELRPEVLETEGLVNALKKQAQAVQMR
ncbi:MAG TPA: GAF domain-containing protein, partial [Ktedonobacteraceae bacterium]